MFVIVEFTIKPQGYIFLSATVLPSVNVNG